MKEKEKGKLNPFVTVLNADEDILWYYVSDYPAVTWSQQIGQFLRIYVPPVFLFSLVPLFLTQLIPADLQSLWCLSTGAVVAITVMPLALAHHQYGQWQRSRFTTEVYAITNKRLLMSVLNTVLSLALEEIQTVELQADSGGMSIVLSHEVFPDWHHVEDAHTARELIVQARAMHLKTQEDHLTL